MCKRLLLDNRPLARARATFCFDCILLKQRLQTGNRPRLERQPISHLQSSAPDSFANDWSSPGSSEGYILFRQHCLPTALLNRKSRHTRARALKMNEQLEITNHNYWFYTMYVVFCDVATFSVRFALAKMHPWGRPENVTKPVWICKTARFWNVWSDMRRILHLLKYDAGHECGAHCCKCRCTK